MKFVAYHRTRGTTTKHTHIRTQWWLSLPRANSIISFPSNTGNRKKISDFEDVLNEHRIITRRLKGEKLGVIITN